jgi:hypothetical protein
MSSRFLSAVVILIAIPAQASNLVMNGSFTSATYSASYPNASFSIGLDGTLTNWTAAPSGNNVLDCLVYGGVNTAYDCGHTVFGGGGTMFYNTPGLGASPDGGNYVAMDGDSGYGTPLYQTISGLVAGQTYVLTFDQAAVQQNVATVATSDYWSVSLGSQRLRSTTMTLSPSGNYQNDYSPWSLQTLTFTATVANGLSNGQEVLSFLAVGPSGAPPFALLDGVSLTATPEPGTFVLLGFALLGIPAAHRLRRRKNHR